MNFSPPSFLLFSYTVAYLILFTATWECCALVMKLKFKKFVKINFKKTKKFYCDFMKTLFFIILHAKEPRRKILISWSMKFINSSRLRLGWSTFQAMFFICILYTCYWSILCLLVGDIASSYRAGAPSHDTGIKILTRGEISQIYYAGGITW